MAISTDFHANNYTELVNAMTVSELQYEIERIESFLPSSAGGNFTDKWTVRLAQVKALLASRQQCADDERKAMEEDESHG